jgi:hypothetical protein
MKARDLFPRLATGAFILNSGLTKRQADRETAEGLQGMAAGAYPQVGEMEPEQFVGMLSKGEMLVGAALLLPFVPNVVAGAALTGFSASLIGLYLRTPSLRQEGSLRPSPQGIPIAKDVWMLGIGLGLLADALFGDDD